MKALIQRVQRASVAVAGSVVGEIAGGFVVLLGVQKNDTAEDARYLAQRTVALRVFPDAQERMNLSLADVGGSVLAVSQFTLHADTSRGNRPSFILAAPADQARTLYEEYLAGLRALLGAERVAAGRFQAHMLLEILNDGPVTIELKSRNEA